MAPTRPAGRLLGLLLALLTATGLAGLAGLTGAGSAAAAGAERILGYRVLLQPRVDGSVRVQETISYDFGGAGDRHGIIRVVPTQARYDATRDRLYPISQVSAQVDGHPAELATDSADGATSLRVGNPDQTVSGRHTYQLDYTLSAVLDRGRQQLVWNAIGTGWDVPIEAAQVSVRGPAPVQQATCVRGSAGASSPCAAEVAGDGTASYSAVTLAPNQGMTVSARFPAGTFAAAPAVLRERWSFARAFAVGPASLAGAAALLLAVLGAGVALTGGRPRRSAAAPSGLVTAPPSGLRPGLLGTLLNETADVQDVTASIVDLAVRGHLSIERIPAGESVAEAKGAEDWRLTRTDRPADGLEEYEQVLLGALFADRDDVLMSQLRTTFAADLRAVQAALYDAVVARGWFPGHPRSLHARWWAGAIGLLTAAAMATWALAAFTHLALIGVGGVLAGVVAVVLAARASARTPEGEQVLARTRAFAAYLREVQGEQLRLDASRDVFSAYLPYAIVFGVTRHWADAFAQAADARGARSVPAPTWYLGPVVWSGAVFGSTGADLDRFSHVTSTAIAAQAPAASGGVGGGGGGFVGGGVGGGGGGSW